MRRYLEELVLREAPSLQGTRVVNVTEIEEGWERSLFAFDLERSGVSKPLIARFYQGTNGSRRATWEAALLRRVGAAGIPVPRVEFVAEDESEYGTAMVVMERVHGSPLTDTLAGSPGVANDMAHTLVMLHGIPVDAVFDETLPPFDEPEFIAPDLESVALAIDRYGLVEFLPLIEQLRASVPVDQSRCVLHNDYTPENILIKEDGELTILDWSFAGVGDHRLDVAWSALWAGVRAGSEARAEFLSAYEDASGQTIARLEYFEALRTGARLITIAGWLDDVIEFPAIKVNKDVISGGYHSTVIAVYERFRTVTGLRLARFEEL